MSKTKKYLAILVAAFLLFELSVIFGEYDLDIWLGIGNTSSKFGVLMETVGELVAPLMCAACGVILSVYYYIQTDSYKNKKAKVSFSTAIVAIGLGYSVFLLMSRDLEVWIRAVALILIALLYAGIIFVIKQLGEERMFQLYCIALTIVIYSIVILILINAVKICWGRIRPRDLIEYAQFTPFFDPQGVTGNRSFPSGHTANASILYAITMFAPLVKNKLGKIALYVVPILWILMMALSRVIVGAHFASDVLYGAGLSILTFYIVKKLTLYGIERSIS